MFRKKDSGSYRQLIEGVELNTLVHGQKTLMGQFRLTKGAKIPLHEHPHEQTGIMISGRVRFEVGGEIFEAAPGDSWNIPGDVPHSAEAMEDAVVIEVFSPVREDYLP